MSEKKNKVILGIMAAYFAVGFLVLGIFAVRQVRAAKPEEAVQTEDDKEQEEELPFLSDEEARALYGALDAGAIISEEDLSRMNPSALFYVEEISDAIFARINGVSFDESGVIAREDLRYIRLLHVDFEGTTHIGELVANADYAEEICGIFQTLYNSAYAIESVLLIDNFDGDDEASMAADNTSCFNYRNVSGDGSLSKHAYGTAVDINPLYNPYVTQKGVQPAAGEAYADRTKDFAHKIDEEDICYKAFTEAGYTWGGSWKSVKDYQHFEKEPIIDEEDETEEAAETTPEDGRKYVVVIDPGHGGDNSGANAYGPIEKDMTLTTANAMYAALSQYDNVTVYMTRTGDQSLSLDQRAAFAQSKNADFLFSLHYNASGDHERYGAEVLVSQVAPYNAMGYQFGVIELEQLKAMGMYIRGIKGRTGNNGDYYGLLRSASAKGIPAVIIEHCYLDQADDHNRCASVGQQQAFGAADATAVAKYLGLYSTALGVDYRGYGKANVDLNSMVGVTYDNMTGPEELWVSQVAADAASGTVTLAVHGYDSDDPLIYYDYSTDGGASFSSPRAQWPGANPVYGAYDTDFTFTVNLPPGADINIMVRAFTMFDQYTVSAPLHIDWGTPVEEPQPESEDVSEVPVE